MVETRAKRRDSRGRRFLQRERSGASKMSTQGPQVLQDRHSHALSPATNSKLGIRALFDDIAANTPGTRQAVPVPEVDLIPTSPGEIRSLVKASSLGGSTTTLVVPAEYDLLPFVKFEMLGYLKNVVDENYNTSETVDTAAQKEYFLDRYDFSYDIYIDLCTRLKAFLNCGNPQLLLSSALKHSDSECVSD